MESPHEGAKTQDAEKGQRSIEDTLCNEISSATLEEQAMRFGEQSELPTDLELEVFVQLDRLVDRGVAFLVNRGEDPTEYREKQSGLADLIKRNCLEIRVAHEADAKARESMGECYKPIEKIEFFSFPREIRNRIMEFALVPGHIYFSEKTRPVRSDGSPEFLPACQILATCKQLYQEGHVSFYSSNMFHFAPGPLSASWKYFGRLNSRHQDLIERVSIEMSFMDLTPPVLKRIEKAFYQNHGQSIAHAEADEVATYVQNALRYLWNEKIAGIRDKKSFEVIHLVNVIPFEDICQENDFILKYWKCLQLEGVGINKLLSSIKPGQSCERWGEDPDDVDEDGWDSVLLRFLEETSQFTMSKLSEYVWDSTREGHWVTLKRWMSEVKIGTEYEESRDTSFWCEKSGWVHHRLDIDLPDLATILSSVMKNSKRTY